MSAKSEWELLCISEDIEVGDTLDVELHQKIVPMILAKAPTALRVTLVDASGNEHYFKTENLEGWGGPGYIVRKAKKQLTMKQLRSKK